MRLYIQINIEDTFELAGQFEEFLVKLVNFSNS